MAPLEIVGQLAIPGVVLEHRFVREALACANVLRDSDDFRERVVGTANTRKPELYGWAPDVDLHADKTGYVYLAALTRADSTLHVHCPGAEDDAISVCLTPGTVVRLDDHAAHWTSDSDAMACVFIGSYDTPCDVEAVDQLQRAIAALAAGQYYGAPRVRAGFRCLQADECLVPNEAWDDCEPTLLEDAIAKDLYYEVCHCGAPATSLLHHWPYDSGGLCHAHAG